MRELMGRVCADRVQGDYGSSQGRASRHWYEGCKITINYRERCLKSKLLSAKEILLAFYIEILYWTIQVYIVTLSFVGCPTICREGLKRPFSPSEVLQLLDCFYNLEMLACVVFLNSVLLYILLD